FTVSWSGQDLAGPGIATYDVFVSDNGGPFTPFLTDPTRTFVTFTGQEGHRYAFFSVATDNVGNVQPTPPAAQATTHLDTPPPTSTVNSLTSISPATFTVSWSGQDNPGGSGLASYQVYVSDNNSTFTLWQPATTQTSASFTGQDGHTYAFYSVASDQA